MAILEANTDLDVKGRLLATDVPNSTGSIVTWNANTNVFGLRTDAQILSDIGAQPAGSYVPTSRTLTAGNGLSGGGNLTANRTFTLGTPSSIGLASTNGVTSTSHTHALDSATTAAINQGVTAHGWGDFRDFGLGQSNSSIGDLDLLFGAAQFSAFTTSTLNQPPLANASRGGVINITRSGSPANFQIAVDNGGHVHARNNVWRRLWSNADFDIADYATETYVDTKLDNYYIGSRSGNISSLLNYNLGNLSSVSNPSVILLARKQHPIGNRIDIGGTISSYTHISGSNNWGEYRAGISLATGSGGNQNTHFNLEQYYTNSQGQTNPLPSLIECEYNGETWLGIHFTGNRNPTQLYFTGTVRYFDESDCLIYLVDTEVSNIQPYVQNFINSQMKLHHGLLNINDQLLIDAGVIKNSTGIPILQNHPTLGVYLGSTSQDDIVLASVNKPTWRDGSNFWELATESWVSANFDNYGSWNLKTNGVQRTTVQSGGDLDLVAGTNVTLNYSAGGVVTINSTDTNTTYSAGNGIGLSGTVFSVAAGTGLTQNTSGLSISSGVMSDIAEGVTAHGWGNHATQGYLTSLPSHTINTHSDVNITTPSNGQVLKYDNGSWVNVADETGDNNYVNSISFNTGTGVLTLGRSGLSDLTEDLDGRYSLESHNHTLDSLSNVTITSNTSGEILKWNGSAWINNTLAQAGIASSSHTHANLSTGTGLTGSTYNGGTARTFAFDTTWGDNRYLPFDASVANSIDNSIGTDADLLNNVFTYLNASALNTPSEANGYYVLSGGKINSASGYKAQLFLGTNDDAMYYRSDNGGTGTYGTMYHMASRQWVQAQSFATTSQLPTVNNNTITINPQGILTGGGSFNLNQGSNETLNITAPSFGTTSGTVAEGNHTHSASDITSGTISYARLPFSSTDVSNWNTAYGWGDHSTEGYLTSNQTITLSGDVSGSGSTSIAVTIAASAVEAGMLNNNIISGKTALTSGLASTDELMISDAGVIKRMDVSVLQTYMQSNLAFSNNSGTVTSVSGGNGLTGTVTSSGSISMGTPSAITLSSTNSTTSSSHTHAFTPGGTVNEFIDGTGHLQNISTLTPTLDEVLTAGNTSSSTIAIPKLELTGPTGTIEFANSGHIYGLTNQVTITGGYNTNQTAGVLLRTGNDNVRLHINDANKISFKTESGTIFAKLETSLLTTNRSYQFPNYDGDLAVSNPPVGNYTNNGNLMVNATNFPTIQWIANFTANRTLYLSNFRVGASVLVMIQNSNPSNRNITIQASNTTTTYHNVNMYTGDVVNVTGIVSLPLGSLANGAKAVLVTCVAANNFSGIILTNS